MSHKHEYDDYLLDNKLFCIINNLIYLYVTEINQFKRSEVTRPELIRNRNIILQALHDIRSLYEYYHCENEDIMNYLN